MYRGKNIFTFVRLTDEIKSKLLYTAVSFNWTSCLPDFTLQLKDQIMISLSLSLSPMAIYNILRLYSDLLDIKWKRKQFIKLRKKEKITIKRWWKIQINDMYYKKWIKWKCMYICVCVIYVHVNVFVCMLECAVLMMVFMCNVEICRFFLLVVGVLLWGCPSFL